MKYIIAVCTLVSSMAFAGCDDIPAFSQFKKVTTPFSTLTGNYRMQITMTELSTVECVARHDSLEFAGAARVQVFQGQSMVQDYTTTVMVNERSSSVSFKRPSTFIEGGMILSLGQKNTLQLGPNAVMPVTVER